MKKKKHINPRRAALRDGGIEHICDLGCYA